MTSLADTPGASPALALLRDAYGTRLTRPGRRPDHSIQVAELLVASGASPRVVVAGLLHDLLEDTDVTSSELRRVCGNGVGGLVEALTQDSSIPIYRRRKAALRARIVATGRDAAVISLADKLAKLQGLSTPPRKRKLRHYRATLHEVDSHYGPTALGRQLGAELERFGWPPR